MARKRDDWLEVGAEELERYRGELSHLYALCGDLPFTVIKMVNLHNGKSFYWHECEDGQTFSAWGFLPEEDLFVLLGRRGAESSTSKGSIRIQIENDVLVGFQPLEMGRIYQHVMRALADGPLPF
ncbi:hypothetical protein RYA05_00020 [Pseudomonas syringae pv. actinidiae]|nr:hypothetical protein [Pseudomonas syringae pv. actinidiae]